MRTRNAWMPGLCLASLSLLIFGQCASPQSDWQSTLEVLDELIEESRAIKTFHAVYEVDTVVSGQPGATTIELVYAGPDLASFRVTPSSTDSREGPESERFEAWIIEGERVFFSLEDGWFRFPDFLSDSRCDLLCELFPMAIDARPFKLGFMLEVEDDEQGRPTKWALKLVQEKSEDAVLFEWLLELRDRSPKFIARLASLCCRRETSS